MGGIQWEPNVVLWHLKVDRQGVPHLYVPGSVVGDLRALDESRIVK